MKTSQCYSSKSAALLAGAVLFLTVVACRFTTKTVQPDKSPAVSPAYQQPADSKTTAVSPQPARPANLPSGGFDLIDPLQGMETLASYRQRFTLSLEGAAPGGVPFSSVQSIERQVSDADESLHITETSTGASPVEMFLAALQGYRYSQDQVSAFCLAEPSQPEKEYEQNPASRLPAIYGMQEVERGEWNAVRAIHYSFDRHSLVDQEGVLKGAAGQVWIAEGSGIVLKYDLSIEIASKDFAGTRAWAYELDQINQGQPVQLPDSCQPVLADLPMLSDAADLVLMPGFQRYTASATRAEAVSFLYDQLSAQGWQPLPGSSPDQVDLSFAVTPLSFTQPYGEGSRVLVVQLTEQNGLLQVVAQTSRTRQPVEANMRTDIIPQPEASVVTPEQPTGAPAALPADLPQFPGASVLTQVETTILLEAQATQQEIVDFYTQQMENGGWNLDQKIDSAGIVVLMWSRGSQSLAINIMPDGNKTQITVSAIR